MYKLVGRVLLNRGVVEKKNVVYELVDFNLLSDEVRRLIVEECDRKIDAFIQKRGLNVWEHRRKNRRPLCFLHASPRSDTFREQSGHGDSRQLSGDEGAYSTCAEAACLGVL